jgi:hypothetical protein
LTTLPFAVHADELEEELLGSVSATYESNGNPGSISGGSGDLGGASYGAYQFAGSYDVPLAFANWCVSSGEGKTTGQTLLAAYKKDGNTFNENFKKAWQSLAEKDKDGFLRLQRLYIKAMYYQPAVEALKKQFGLDINCYGIAFKNAVWSRAVQHGVGSYVNENGFLGIMKEVDKTLPYGVMGATEKQLITAIYEESGKVVTSGKTPMTTATAGGNAWIIRQYSLEGKYMKYFSGNSSAVQAGVYLRLRIRELSDLLKMLETYGGYVDEGQYGNITPVVVKNKLTLSDCDALDGWHAGKNTAIALTTQTKQQGKGSLALLAMEDSCLSASLQFSHRVNLSGCDGLSFGLSLPDSQEKAVLQVTMTKEGKGVYTTEISLEKGKKGFQDLTVSFPKNTNLTQIDGITFSFESLPQEMIGKRIYLDHVWAGLNLEKMKIATVNADALNCRQAPGTGYAALGQFLDGTQVKMLGQSVNGWYYCYGMDADGDPLLGWCSGDYLVVKRPASKGDVNGDDIVNATDALRALQYAIGKTTLTDTQKSKADMNGDGNIDAADSLDILKIAVGKD